MPPLIIFTSKSAKSNHHLTQKVSVGLHHHLKRWCNRGSWQ